MHQKILAVSGDFHVSMPVVVAAIGVVDDMHTAFPLHIWNGDEPVVLALIEKLQHALVKNELRENPGENRCIHPFIG